MISRFLSELRVELINDAANEGRGLWRLTAPLVYRSNVADELFIVPRGFATDFASVPRLIIVFAAVGDTAHEAAAVHDFLYSTHPVSRKIADAVLREAAIVSCVPAWRAWLLWAGVRAFGWSHWKSTERLPTHGSLAKVRMPFKK